MSKQQSNGLLRAIAVGVGLALGATAWADAPTYHKVEWIASSGGQALPLPVNGKSGLKVEMKMRWTSFTWQGKCTAIGCKNATATVDGATADALFDPIGLYHKSWTLGYKTSDDSLGVEFTANTDYVVVSTMNAGEQKLTRDGTQLGSTKTQSAVLDIGVPLSVFARYVKNAKGVVSYDQYAYVRLYYVKIWDGDELIYDGIPCADANFTYGLYDQVSQTISLPTVGTLTAGAFWNETTSAYDLYHVAATAGANGTVTVEPAQDLYAAGTKVTVTAKADAGYGFAQWSGNTAISKFEPVQTYSSLAANVAISSKFLADNGPIRRYMAPTAVGKKDGTSWENASADLTAMLVAVGTNPQGGEVWMKKGNYQQSSTIELLSNVRLIGGFAGDETEASAADPSVNHTTLHGSNKTYNWYASGVDTGVAIVGADGINLPPAENYPMHRTWTSNGNNCQSYYLYKSSGSLTNSVIDGVDFATAHNYAMYLSTTGADGFLVKNCRFAGCTYGQGSSAVAVFAANSDITFENCGFYGNRQAFRSESSTACLLTLRNCTFKYNRHCDYSKTCNSACVSCTGKTSYRLEGCLFHDNVANAKYYAPAATMHLGSSSAVTVSLSNCTFHANYSALKSVGNIVLTMAGGSKAIFDDCRFLANTNTGVTGYAVSPCIGIDNSIHLKVLNSYFAHNCNDLGTAGATSSGTILAIGSAFYSNAAFVNSTIENNYARMAPGRLVSQYRCMHQTYINCLIRNNDTYAGDGVTRTPQITGESYRAGPCAFNAINTIFMHETAADYLPVEISSHFSYNGWANSYVQGIDFTSRGYGNNGFGYNFLTGLESMPVLTAEYAKTKAGNPALGIDKASKLFRKGRKVWEGNEGWYYIYDDVKGKWRELVTRGDGYNAMRVLTDAQAAGYGLSFAKAPLPDAVGRAQPRRSSPGPVQVPPLGTMLLVR